MARLSEHLVSGAFFHDLAAVHDRDAITQTRDDTEVVSDQDNRGSALTVERRKEFQDLRLDRHVESGRRLVRDDHVGLVRQRDRDHHTLGHAS